MFELAVVLLLTIMSDPSETALSQSHTSVGWPSVLTNLIGC